ncbi:MAG: PspC domain-containing protein [Gammaproteobacteria bacterium]|jgi:phage shock protein C
MTPEFLEDVAVRTRRLRRNRENGLFYGVCAGISEGFRWPVNTVRLVAVLSLIVFFLPTVTVYLAAAMVLPAKPLTFHGAREDVFWKSRGRRGSRRLYT